jgi:hypothetical protein
MILLDMNWILQIDQGEVERNMIKEHSMIYLVGQLPVTIVTAT